MKWCIKMSPIYIWKEYDWPYEPSSNTLLYLPFTEDMADYSWNNRTITNDLWEIKDWYFYNDDTTNSKSWLVVANMPDVWSWFTLTFWEKKTWAYANTQQPLFRYDWWNTVHSFDAGSWIWFRLWWWDNNRTVPNNWADTRRMITFTYTWSVMALYVNDTLIASTSRSFSSPWWNQTYFWWWSTYTPYQWYISHLIEENYWRTAQEVSNYYNLTKWNYS